VTGISTVWCHTALGRVLQNATFDVAFCIEIFLKQENSSRTVDTQAADPDPCHVIVLCKKSCEGVILFTDVMRS